MARYGGACLALLVEPTWRSQADLASIRDVDGEILASTSSDRASLGIIPSSDWSNMELVCGWNAGRDT